MREIKFRAWDKSENRIIGYEELDKLDTDGVVLFGEMFKSDTHYIVMQYAGLKDRGGKEIYEGDVLRVTDFPTNEGSCLAEVTFKHGSFNATSKKTNWPLGDYGGENHGLWREIIGNIYENPELLK